MTYPHTLRYVLILVIQSITLSITAQKFIQLELPGDPIAIKYYEGMSISYKHIDYPEEYNDRIIRKIDVDNQMLVFDDGYITMDEITHVRRYRPWAKAIGYSMITFGTVWLTYGGIAHVATDDFDFGVDTAIIGGTSLIAGWLVKRYLYTKNYKIGKYARLRMLDITMPSPEEVYDKDK